MDENAAPGQAKCPGQSMQKGDERALTEEMTKKWKRAVQTLMAVVIAGVFGFLIFVAGKTYEDYIRLMVAQQQQHLLITARAVAQNLELYLSEQMRDIDILVKTPGFLEELQRFREKGDEKGVKEYIISYMLSQEEGIARLYLLDEAGEEIFHYSRYPFLEEFDEERLMLPELSKRHQRGIGNIFRINEKHYGLTLVNSIVDGNDYVGTMVSVLDMEKLYQNYVQKLEHQGIGDILVKNEAGNIIMHSNEALLGFNAIRDIEGIYALPQYESLLRMLNTQYENEEGSAQYRSYANGLMPPRDEVASFSRMNLDGTIWFVTAVMPYSDILKLVQDNFGRFALLIAALLIIAAAVVLVVYALWKNRQKLQMEARYLKEINSTLEALQESREQIQHIQKLQTIGTLASGIVHEFNNLLIPILGYSEFLKKELGEESEYYEDIDEIHKAGLRAKDVVEQILPFGRKETEASAYEAVSLEVVLRDVLKTIRMFLPKEIKLSEELSARHMTVFGSATQLHQVFLNLCQNGLQAMEANARGVLFVRSGIIAQSELPKSFHPVVNGSYAFVEIADTGCGIEEEVLPHIFDPFFTTKGKGEGTGLGLSVVHEILISHKGFVEVKSEKGKGSRFYVFLPLWQQA